MSDQLTLITTPTGRLVSGSVSKGNDKDADGNPLTIKTGPNAGQSRTEYYFAVAVEKTNPEVNQILQIIQAEGQKAFPNGQAQAPAFSWKYTDGDSTVPNTKGIKPCDREGWAGCWVFHFSGSIKPQCFTSQNQPIADPDNQIKRGYFVRVHGSVKGNGSSQSPGVYLNHKLVQLVAFGEEIISGPRAEDVFGAAPSEALPSGASLTPPAPTAPMPATQLAPPPATATPAAPPPPAATPAPPAPGVTPAKDFLTPPPPPADPVAETFAVGGQDYTREQLKAAGYTDAQIDALPKSDSIPF